MTAWDEVQDEFDELLKKIEYIEDITDKKKDKLEEAEYILFKNRIQIILFALEYIQ